MKHGFRRDDFRWEGVAPAGYAAQGETTEGGGYRGVTRHILSGGAGEPSTFQVRYFQVEPGGYTRLERHEHIHSVTVIRGRGYAIVGETVHQIADLDHVYVPPMTLHQFVNEGDTPFGFLCIVDAARDRPQQATPDDLARLESNAATAGKARV
jgi:quercetin dioxygenase-like cupin family protein